MILGLAGPVDTAALGCAIGMDLSGLPIGFGYSPIIPLCIGLLKKGHKVHIITLDAQVTVSQDYQLTDSLRITYCPIRAAPFYRARTRSLDLFKKEIAFIRDAIKKSDLEFVHAHWTYEFAEGALRSGKPVLVTMHDLGWDYLWLFRDSYRAIRLLMKFRTMLRARHVSAVSPFVARKAWQYGFFRAVPVVPNPIEYAPLTPKNLGKPILVTIGNTGRLKNVAASVAALKLIRRRFGECELHLFGPGLDKGGPFGHIEGVVCHGNVAHEELMTFLQDQATILVHPSKLETFGMIIAEAKVRGVPVVAGLTAGGVPYVVGDAGGCLVDIEDPNSIALAVTGLLEDKSKYENMQVEGHADILKRFSLSDVTEQYCEIYSSILDDRNPI